MVCPRCEKETRHEKDFCVLCGQATSTSTVEEVKAEEQDLRVSHPHKVELLDNIENAQEAMIIFLNCPDLLDDAGRFREVLGDS